MHNVVTYMAVLLFLNYLLLLKCGDRKTRDFTQVKSEDGHGERDSAHRYFLKLGGTENRFILAGNVLIVNLPHSP